MGKNNATTNEVQNKGDDGKHGGKAGSSEGTRNAITEEQAQRLDRGEG